jgi:hypothetical protein
MYLIVEDPVVSVVWYNLHCLAVYPAFCIIDSNFIEIREAAFIKRIKESNDLWKSGSKWPLAVALVSSGEWGVGQVVVVVVAICWPRTKLADTAATRRELNHLKNLNRWISKPLDFYNSKLIIIIIHLFGFFFQTV